MTGHNHNHEHEHGHCCCEKEHGHSHGHNHVITAGSKCCSSCGTEAAAKPAECGCGGHDTQEKEHSGENDDGDQPSHRCSCCSASGILSENGDDGTSFKKEITFLGAIGAIFALTLIFEHTAQPDSKLTFYTYILICIAAGFSVFKEMFYSLKDGDLFNEFTLMGFASLAAIAVGAASEAAGVMIFYRLGEAFQEKASHNARTSISSLLAQKPTYARLCTGEQITKISPGSIKKGDIIQVLPGEQIPIDGIVVGGESYIDTSPITGEALPRRAAKGSNISSGTIAADGMIMVEASGAFKDSTIQRILDMVQNAAEKKSPTERFITKFARGYTPAVFALAALVAVIPPIIGLAPFKESLYRGLVLLVISCPCALVISIPLGYFGGIGAASQRGILVKGSYVFDSLKNITTAVFDKTGTLTEGVFKIAQTLTAEGVTKDELLHAAALAESASTHPIAKSISAELGHIKPKDDAVITQIPGKGILYKDSGATAAAGSASLIKELGAAPMDVPDHGASVHVMKDGKYMGCIILSDVIKKEAFEIEPKLRSLGMTKLCILSGDRQSEVGYTAKELHFDAYEAELLPDGKIEALNRLSENDTSKTMFVGDGINDAPVLIASGIGIAMGGIGSHAAVEAADAVILDDSPAKCSDLIKIAKKTRTVVWQNIAASLGVKAVFMALGAAGIAGLWEAVFADVGVALLAILNASRTTKV